MPPTASDEPSPAQQAVQAVAKPLGAFLTMALPMLIKGGTAAWETYQKLPQNCIHFIIGCFFCFFGGIYPVLFAAVQAAEHGGRKTVVDSIRALSYESLAIIEESKKDDDKDDDKDGKKDVEQISGGEYLQRKTLLVLKKMNPEKIDTALHNMYTVWLSVAAVLSIKFARTVNMALSVAEFLNKPCDRFITPVLQVAIPDEYDKWVPVVLRWVTKSIAMSIAWYLQSIQSAFTSALIGGLYMARAFFHFCVHRGFSLGGLIPEDHSKSNLDEILSYGFAALGFYVQLKSGFSISGPLKLILWPLDIAEYYLRWTITAASGGSK